MKYSKKTYKKGKKKSYKKRGYNNYKPKVKHNYLCTKRYLANTVATGNDTIPGNGGGYFFKLTDLTNYTEFTSLFDQYMIVGIQYRFVMRLNPDFNTTSSFKGVYPIIRWVHDHDDSSAPGNASELYQYPYMKEFNFSTDKNVTRWFYLKPALANEVFGTALATAYAPKWRQWCDNAYPGIQHYGLRWYYDNLYAGQTLTLECKYILKFKGVV